MPASVRLPAFDEQDFIGPEGRELLATLAEVEDDGNAPRPPSHHPFGGPSEAWGLRTKIKSGLDSVKKTSKYGFVSGDQMDRKGFSPLEGYRTGGGKGVKKSSKSIKVASSKLKTPDGVPFRDESSKTGFGDLPSVKAAQTPLRASIKKETGSGTKGKKGVFFPGLAAEQLPSQDGDSAELLRKENEMPGFEDEISKEDEKFQPFFSPLNENLDAKLRQWSNAQRSQDVRDFALPPIKPRQLETRRRGEERRSQSAHSVLDAVPELPRPRSAVVQPQTARQYVWETTATAKERHLNMVTEAELRRSKAALDAEENELLKLEEQIHLHETAFNDFLSSNYEKVTSTLQRTAAIKAQRKEQEARLEYFSGLLQESQTELQEESERLQEVSAYHQFLQAVTPEQTLADLQAALHRRTARKKALTEDGKHRLGQEPPAEDVPHLNHLEEEVRMLRLLDISDSDLYENSSSFAQSNQPSSAQSSAMTTSSPASISKNAAAKVKGNEARGITKSGETSSSTKILRRTKSKLKFRTDSFFRAKSKEKLLTESGAQGTKSKVISKTAGETKQSKEKSPAGHSSEGPDSTISKETLSSNDGSEAVEKHEYLNEHGYDEHLNEPSYLIYLGDRYENQCHTLLTLLTRLEDHIEVTQNELESLAQGSKNRAEELLRWGHRPQDPLCHRNLRVVKLLKDEWGLLSQKELTKKKLQQTLSLIAQIVLDVFGRHEHVCRLLQVETSAPNSEDDDEVPGGMALLSLLEARFTDLCIQLDAIPPAQREQIFQDCENDRKMLAREKQKKEEEEKREQRRKIHLERALAAPPQKQY